MAVREPVQRPPRRRLTLAAVVFVVAATALAVPAAADTPAAPGRPTGLRVVSAAHDQVTIAWDDPGDASISGYQVLRRLRDSHEVGRFDVIADSTGTADTEFTDTEVTPETRYVYRVKAVNSVGVSRQSTFLRARPPPPPPINSDDGNDGGEANNDNVIPDEAIPFIQDPDKLTDGDPVPARSIVTVDPPLLQTSTQTIDDLDRTHYPDLVLDAANGDPRSVWSDGVTLWVGDDADEKVYGYELSGTFGSRVSAKDIAGVTAEAFFVTGFGDRLWTGDEGAATDSGDPWAYAFDLPGLERSSGHDFALRSGTGADTVGVTSNRGMASDGNYLWVAAGGGRVTAQAFRLFDDPATAGNDYGTKDTSRDLGFGEDGLDLHGIFTDGAIMWGVEVGESTVRAVRVADDTRVPAAEFELHADNDNPRGIWSNGVTMFVVDEVDAKIYTYRVGDVEVSGVPAAGVAHVSAGGYHSCVLGGTGSSTRVDCSGGYGPFGSTAPVPDAGSGRHYEMVSAGGFHSCALLDNGAVKCWGNNDYGQAPADRSHSDTTLEYVSIDAGVWHTCAVVDDGSLECWGRNDDGQLGEDPDLTDSVEEFDVPELADGLEWIQVSAGGYLGGTRTDEGSAHSRTCGLVLDGTTRCWGHDAAVFEDVPAAGAGLHYTSVSVGGAHVCATRSDGELVCWGERRSVESAQELVRDGAAAPRIVCTDATDADADDAGADERCTGVIASPGGQRWDSVSAGVWHTCGTTVGEVFCWGNRAWFDDSAKAHHHPQHDHYNAPSAAQPDNARHPSAGYWHTCWTYGAETAPKVICTGDNGLGQARWKKKTLD